MFNEENMQEILSKIVFNYLPVNNPVNPLNYAITISQGLT